VRASLKALRAASTMAAGALTQATGSAAITAGLGTVWEDGDQGQQQQGQGQTAAGGSAGGGRPDAVLLQRLMVSGPGTELVLSDEEA
jgi:hypothetical protein